MAPSPAGLAVDVAFVCAMPSELEPITSRLGLEPERLGEIEVWLGRVRGSQRVAGVVTGMGPELAGPGTTALLDALVPERLAVVGITGAVHDHAPIGEVVDVSVVVDGVTGQEHHPHRIGTGIGSRPPAVTGALWTTAEVITEPEAIARLGRAGVVALDMETAVTARACAERGVPWGVYRAVSDLASDGRVGEYVAHLSRPDGSVDPARMDRYFARRPDRVEAMTGLIADVASACRAAAAAALGSTLGL